MPPRHRRVEHPAAPVHRRAPAHRQHHAAPPARPGSRQPDRAGVGGDDALPSAGATVLRDRHPHRPRRPRAPLAGSARPGFKAIHPLGAQLPLECPGHHELLVPEPAISHDVSCPDVSGVAYSGRTYVPPTRCTGASSSTCWRAPAERWVLKAPSHVFAFDALFEAYPDALIVQTHRDPVTVLASVASLTAVLRSAFSDTSISAEIGLEVTRHWADGLESCRARPSPRADSRGALPRPELSRARRTIRSRPSRRIYAQFDLPLTAAAGERDAAVLWRGTRRTMTVVTSILWPASAWTRTISRTASGPTTSRSGAGWNACSSGVAA